jgi:hypothetical protein
MIHCSKAPNFNRSPQPSVNSDLALAAPHQQSRPVVAARMHANIGVLWRPRVAGGDAASSWERTNDKALCLQVLLHCILLSVHAFPTAGCIYSLKVEAVNCHACASA